MSISIFIIAITALISVTAFQNQELFNKLKLNPYMVVTRKEYLRIIGHAFLHANWPHLFFNMFTLYFFGEHVEYAFKHYFSFGGALFVVFYLISAVISALPTIGKHKNNHYYNSVGASGAVSAVVMASILYSPTNNLGLVLVPGLKIPGFIFGALYIAYSHYMSRRKIDNINHDAHLTGAIFGFAFPLILKPELWGIFLAQIEIWYNS